MSSALEVELGPLLRWIGHRYFTPVRVSSESETRLRQLSERGFVVHVMRTTSWVNYLFIAWALVKRELPPVRAVVNLRRWLTRPWRRTAGRGDPEVRFSYARRHGGSALIFLKRSAIARPLGRLAPEDPFPALVAWARRQDRPTFLVPELFVWEKWSARLKPGPMDLVFGSPEAPGFLHSILAFWRNHERAQFRVGEPIDLSTLIREQPGASDAVIARKLRSTLAVHLAKETRAVFGPPFKPAVRTIDETLRDRTLRKALQQEAQEKNRPLESVVREARKDLNQIAARYHPTVVAMMAPILQWIFNRIYDGIEVDEAGLDRAMAVASDAPIVLCPSHKSHIDYLVLSWVLWKRGYTVPRVAAGANLSFFPLGPLLRGGGAFFLRRSFKDDRVYTAAFKAYLKKLVRDRALQEFFPEGGRSRTGKLLPPKLGMLTWEVDAVLEGASPDLFFIPVSIDYEKVVESQSYTHELSGGEKQKEDLRALLGARKVLTAKYGRIHLTFDEPVSLAAFAQSRGVSLDEGLSEGDKKGFVRALGNRVMFGISRVSTVTPQALLCAALLSGKRAPVPARVLSDRIQLLRRMAEEVQAPLSKVLHHAPADPTVIGPIQEALRGFAEEGLVRVDHRGEAREYEAVEAARIQLVFYKNTLINCAAPRSLVSSAVRAGGDSSLEAVKARALFLSRLFKLEFIYQVGAPFDVLFARTLEGLARWGVILPPTDRITVAPEAHSQPNLEFLASLMRDYLEAYWVAAVALRQMAPGLVVERRGWVKQTLELSRSLYVRGEIKLPESMSRPLIENALGYFEDRQLVVAEGKSIRLAHETTGATAAQLAEEIHLYLAPVR